MSSNQTSSPALPSNQEIIAWCGVYGIEALVTVLGNGLTITVFAACKSLHRRTYSLLISLAVADLLVGALAAPMFIAVVAQFYGWMTLDAKMMTAQRIIEILTSYGSMVTLTVIALERLMAVMYPLKHSVESKLSYATAIGISWIIAVLMASLSLLGEYYNDRSTNHAVFIILMVMMILCMFVTCLCYVIIAIRLQAYSQSSFLHSYPERGRREHNLAITLLIASVVFILTWLPFQVINWIYFLTPNHGLSVHSVYASKFLHYFNSLANPLIYTFRMPEFRTGIVSLFKCHAEQPPEQRGARAWHINATLDDETVGVTVECEATKV